MSTIKPKVSVIVSSYTMERFHDLAALLDSLQSQTCRDSETIVITERSTELYDKLLAYCQEKDYNSTRVLFNQGLAGLSPSRNMGIKEAKGDIIAFIDDDALPSSDWLEAIIGSFQEDAAIIGVTGPVLPLWEDESMKWLPEEFYWLMSCTGWFDGQEKTDIRNLWGNNMAVTREAFDNNRLFGESFGSIGEGNKGNIGLTSDDTEFSLRLTTETQKRIIFNPDIQVWHRVYAFRFKPEFIRRLAYRHGYTKAIINKLYGRGRGKDVLDIERRLLKRILFRLLPSIFAGFLRHPAVSWRRLSVTRRVLWYTALGYLMASMYRDNALRINRI